MKKQALIVCASAGLLLSGCEKLDISPLVNSLVNPLKGDGNIQVEERPLDGKFENLDIQAPIEIEYTQSDSDKGLSIHADANILPLIQTSVSNNRLLIKLAQSYNTATQSKMILKGPALSDVQISAPAKFSMLGLSGKEPLSMEITAPAEVLLSNPNCSSFKLTAGNAAVIEIRSMNIGSFEAKLSDATSLTAYGTLESLNLSGVGASRISALNLIVGEATLKLEKASKASLTVNRRLDVNLSDASAMEYAGSPQISSQVSGASTLKAH
ncbi:hypothetical protein COW36_04605 [bacterium (Candidatus Blackallbacteria) CG17_big_fil_post_rev_8_21_14_2_50_48_46]|uniref:Putative auto-transporter adhesin head GIN domain-containing protein n=1 Tax=bacterium (Candidatus Blackallbacteria) CG17_big_fil_post_rev_8_21_14_2_50_48_46 TaxID=2014261 RepID=A0A2M7G913_9BACT|nr:MAG: hypothetical protein COW64_04340 [bacterium (Candidatus Blackallbacteria) CG18_big_fil_WC_8_21_14_2_50_49_26]PIW18577.1 MAG: hypothetical protein COW36_04605 [bacterium (Candidatus Blackallbacteria) CG17_big_fil_post_rev_8_21_14_2_50_48_46]PIW46438.1 MAG: hypothetical protein COW20_16075 [bacterium (Candidatus Blackallbacteria) CG13_big_fil_rev_8_21_14_2_50_49_14]